MDVLVVGASRGSGLATVAALAADGHRVTAFARSASAAAFAPGDVVAFDGDVMDTDALAKAMVGQDAVVVTLGISDNPMKVRLLRRARTPLDVRSAGTQRVIGAMQAAGVRRLVVQTTYGLGTTYRKLPWAYRLLFALLLAPQIRDSERQEQVVRASGLDWTLVRPVALTDDNVDAAAHVDADDGVGAFTVSRTQVGRVVSATVTDPSTLGHTLSISTNRAT